MIYRAFLLAFASVVAMSATASDWQSHEQLKQRVHDHVKQELEQERAEPIAESDVEISVANLDSRLRLADCEDDLHLSITSPPPIGHHVTTKVSCRGASPWAIYLPVRVSTFAKVAVASRNLDRGQLVTQADLELKSMDTAQAGAGYASDVSRLIGMTLKRPVRTGDPVRLAHLEPSKVVSRGDKVVVEARGNGISVVVAGTALAAGVLGERIRVRNAQSNRVVDATVIGPGKVEIVF